MPEAAEHVEKYRFDDFDLLPKQRVLLRAGARIQLTPKPLGTLLLLVERAGNTVSKEEIFAQVWNGALVEENNLTQSISALRKALGEKRGENRYIVTDPGRGYRFVAPVSRVLEDAVAASGPSDTISSNKDVTPGSHRLTWLIALIASAVLLAAGLLTWLWKHRAVHSSQRPSIAVLRIRDLSKTTTESWLQTALPEMLTSELASGGRLRTVPAEDVTRWRSDLGLAADNESQTAFLLSAQRNLGADTFVVGSYVITGACPQCRVRVDLGILQARTGERIGTVIDEGSASDLLDLTTRLGRRLRTELGLNADAPTPSRWPAASAMREYSEGLAALRQGDPIAAREHLEVAVAADPQNALVHSALATAWTALGYGTRANDEDKRAYELAASLDRLDQLGVEARYRASIKDWNRAIEVYKTVFKLFPDSLDDGINLARAQWRALRIADSVATLSELRRLPLPAGNDPRIDLNEAQAAGTQNDFARTRALAHRAAEEAKARGARYLFARARLLEGGAMQSMNDPNAIAVQQEARQTCEAIGDRTCLSQVWRIRGNERYYSGDFAGAQQAYAQGVAIARDLGNRAELANLLVGFAVVERANRDWQQAERNLFEAISLKQETGYNPNEVRNNLAELYISIGRLSDADHLLQFAATAIEQTGAHEDLGDMLLLQSMLARSRGQLDTAAQFANRAVDELRRTAGPVPLTDALAIRSSIHTARGEIDLAEKDLSQAGTGTGPENEGRVALARAELWIAKGQFPNASVEARKAAEAFDKGRIDDQSTLAFVTLSDALDMMGRKAEAAAASREAEQRARLTPNEVSIALSQVAAWQLSPGRDLTIPRELETAIAKLHNPEVRLHLEYVQTLRAKRANAENSRSLARQTSSHAARLGYRTLARRAAALSDDRRIPQ